MAAYIFTSARLGFRKWNEEDYAPFARMNADKQVMEFFPAVMTFDETREVLGRIRLHFEEFGYGWWAVDELATGKFIGFIGFSHPKFESFFTPCIEIGWRLDKWFWGKGFATEGARACLDFGFTELGFKEVYSFTAKVNTPSERVMKKIGMEFVGEFEHPNIPERHWLRKHVVYKKINALIA